MPGIVHGAIPCFAVFAASTDLRISLAAPSDPVEASSKQVPGGSHLGRIDVGLGEVPASEQCGDLEALRPDERQQFAAYALGLFRRMENIFFQTQHGALDAESWEGLLASMSSILSSPGGAEWWARARSLFSPSFREHVERTHPPEPGSEQPG